MSCLHRLHMKPSHGPEALKGSAQGDQVGWVSDVFYHHPGDPVEENRYLGTILDSLLRFSSNTEEILKKCHQRQYLLRKLTSFGVNKDILLTFYHSFIESVLIHHVYIASSKSALKSLDTLLELCLLTRPLTHSTLSVWVAPIRQQAVLSMLQNTKEEGHLCPHSSPAPELWPLPVRTLLPLNWLNAHSTLPWSTEHFDCDGCWKYSL